MGLRNAVGVAKKVRGDLEDLRIEDVLELDQCVYIVLQIRLQTVP